MTVRGGKHRQLIREPSVLDLVAALSHNRAPGLGEALAELDEPPSAELDEETLEKAIIDAGGEQ